MSSYGYNQRIQSVEKFLSEKLASTQVELELPDMSSLPKVHDPITRQEFDLTVNRLKVGKTIGPDGVPTTVFDSLQDLSSN